ncbi:MAG: hypothetical protein ACI8S6_004528 [Myxococcota bacterium]|jgi:hypothetical protein
MLLIVLEMEPASSDVSIMLLELMVMSAAASEPEPGSLDFTRDAVGVAAAVGEILSTLRECSVDAAPGVRVIRLRFDIDRDGVLHSAGAQWPDGDEQLAGCLEAPFAVLRFQPGDQSLPVEVPVSVVVEEEIIHEVQRPIARQ